MNHLKIILKQSKGWLLLVLAVVFTGCNLQPEEKRTPPPPSSPTPVVSESPAPVNETAGQAVTTIFDNFPERNQNLELAIRAIDGTILAPGEEFSFNETVGPRTAEKGYKEAIGYDENGEKKATVGGGVCQISSTLYMAAKNGDFDITERHSHSHEVPYADSKNDATVSYNGYDFRFTNNRDKPVVIHVSTDFTNVYAELIVVR